MIRGRHCDGDSDSDGAARIRVCRRDWKTGGITARIGEGWSWIAAAGWIAATVSLAAAVDVVDAHRRTAGCRVRGKVRGMSGERIGYGEGRQNSHSEREWSDHGLLVTEATD